MCVKFTNAFTIRSDGWQVVCSGRLKSECSHDFPLGISKLLYAECLSYTSWRNMFSHLVVVSWFLAEYPDLPLRQGGAQGSCFDGNSLHLCWKFMKMLNHVDVLPRNLPANMSHSFWGFEDLRKLRILQKSSAAVLFYRLQNCGTWELP
jgi:hypothetical protein